MSVNFSQNGTFMGIIAVADVIKEDSPRAVKELQNMGIHVVMLTGDNERTAKAIGAQAGVDEVIAGVLPEGKEQVIRKLKEKGKVAMVGDGINDAPALTRADMGIAIGAGTDVAIDAADVVLMKSRLSDVPAAIRMSRATLRNIHENLFWAFFYNIIGIPLAAGVWYPLFGWKLNPMFGAAAMSLSSFCVVTNALRLNLFKMYDASKDRKRKMKKVETAENTVSDIVLADKNESENKEETKMTREEAWELLTEYNKDEFHLEHAQIVEGTMRYFARELGYGDEEEFWGIVGLLHDLDFEQYPEQHCIKSQEIMREHGVDERIIHATASHGYGITVDIKPEHEMEKVLYAVDELTGLIGAVTLMRPSKSVQDLELKSVKKKYKSKGFAAGCSREVIERGADMLGWSLDELITKTIEALRTFRP